MTLSKIMLLTFLDANRTLRHKDRFPTRDLKLEVSLFWVWIWFKNSNDGSFFELPPNSSRPEREPSNLTGFLGLGTELEVEEDEELRKEQALKQCRFTNAVLNEYRKAGWYEDDDEEVEDDDKLNGSK